MCSNVVVLVVYTQSIWIVASSLRDLFSYDVLVGSLYVIAYARN